MATAADVRVRAWSPPLSSVVRRVVLRLPRHAAHGHAPPNVRLLHLPSELDLRRVLPDQSRNGRRRAFRVDPLSRWRQLTLCRCPPGHHSHTDARQCCVQARTRVHMRCHLRTLAVLDSAGPAWTLLVEGSTRRIRWRGPRLSRLHGHPPRVWICSLRSRQHVARRRCGPWLPCPCACSSTCTRDPSSRSRARHTPRCHSPRHRQSERYLGRYPGTSSLITADKTCCCSRARLQGEQCSYFGIGLRTGARQSCDWLTETHATRTRYSTQAQRT